MIEKPIVLGVDIGGSHITAALVDLGIRTIIPGSCKRKFVNARDEADKILNNWCDVIIDALNSSSISHKKIGIAMPGPFDYKTGISLIQDQDKFKALYKLNVKEELAKRLNIDTESIRFINDAASFLQGEVFGGAASDYNKVLGLTLGTGLGSAIFSNGIAEDADLWNSDFKKGIAEDYLSSRWFVSRYTELTGKSVNGVKELTQLTDSEIYIKQIFLDFTKNLAEFLIPLIQKYNAEAVVIGGNISNAFDSFLPGLNKVLKENQILVDIKIAHLKEDASLIGAASCWEDACIKAKYNRIIS